MTISPEKLKEIAEEIRDLNNDPADVNKKITAAYHEISEEVRQELGAPTELDWCGFAKWSSNTVGQDLDPSQMGSRIGTIVNDLIAAGVPAPLAGIAAVALHDLRDHDETGKAALRAGNAVIFLEMSLVFTKLLENFAEPTRRNDPEAFAKSVFDQVNDLVHGPFGAGITSEHLIEPDRSVLERGILFYLQVERDPAHQRELILAGNVAFSLYEQERADRLITIGLCAPMRALVVDIFPEILNTIAGIHPPDGWVLSPRADYPEPFGTLDRFAAEFLTERALVVKIAHDVVRLGKPDAVDPAVDPMLDDIPLTLPEVRELLDPLTTAGHIDWTFFDYRMGFIRKYLTVYQGREDAQQKPG
jgi:hypothetical protein